MRKLQNHLIGIDQGSALLFSDFEDGGEMWTGEGPREVRHAITFSQPFKTTPTVQLSLAMFDMDQKTNQRADLIADNVSPTGFEAVFRTWGDTRVARVRTDWMAIGELHDPDAWDID